MDVPLSETSLFGKLRKCAAGISWVNWRADRGREDESTIPPCRAESLSFGCLANLVHLESFDHPIAQRHDSFTGRSFWLNKDESGAGALAYFRIEAAGFPYVSGLSETPAAENLPS